MYAFARLLKHRAKGVERALFTERRSSSWKHASICLFFVFLFGCVKSHDLSPELIIIDNENATDDSQSGSPSADPDDKTVRLEIFAMSKCPFFSSAFFELTPVVESLGQYIDFEIHYVGEIDEQGEITSMHGQEEVEGDLAQLCAQKLGTRKQWLDFLKCQLEDMEAIPQNWRQCAKKINIDTLQIESCYKGGIGKSLLVSSIAVSRKKNIKASPFIMLNGKEYVKPRREVSMGRAVCRELSGRKVEACAKYSPAKEVLATIISDKRCKERDCDKDYLDAFLNNTFDSVKTVTLDYSDPKAAELFKKSGFRFIPIAIFSSSIREDEYAYDRLRDYLVEIEKGAIAYPVGRIFDPSVEICDDKIDNTNNGKIDCDDPYCKGHWLCRQEQKNEIMLFIMSHCPYCTIALKSMNDVLITFNRDRRNIDFSIGFVGEISAEDLYSAHGDKEVAEDLRQICAQKKYPNDYKFMEYILCRNKAFMESRGDEPEDAWKACAKNGISASVIGECATSRDGKQLLWDSFSLAKELEIGGSPTWLLNNKYEMDARSANDILDEFCHRNANNPACASHLNKHVD
jgi:hypothetical protein